MKIHPVSTTTNSKPLIARFKKLLTIIIVFNNFLGFFLVIPADHHADVTKGLVRRIFLIQKLKLQWKSSLKRAAFQV